MRFSIVLMCAIILFLLAGVIPSATQDALPQLFKTPVFIFMGFLLCVASFIGVIKRWKNPGFVLMHLGIIVLLVGAFIGHLKGMKGGMTVGINYPAENRIQLADGTITNIPVSVEALDFKVEHYPPEYSRYVVTENMQQETGSFHVDENAETVDVPGFGEMKVDEFRMGSMWMPRMQLLDGSFVVLHSQTPKRYETRLRFDGETEADVIINYPKTYKGWRFYLMSYDNRQMQYVVLSARHDPGRPMVVAGIWMVIIGSFVMTFFKGVRRA